MKSFRVWALFATGILAVRPILAQHDYSAPFSFTTFAGVAGEGTTDGPVALARFSGPNSLAFDSAGNLYVADGANSTIRKISPAGVVTTVAGRPLEPGHADGAGNIAQFDSPTGIVVDGSGNLYVAESGNHDIRKISSVGVVSTLAGAPGVAGAADGSGTAARFNFPMGLALDSAGNLYVADVRNHTIRRIAPDGVVSTVAGSPGVSGSTDGTGSSARFNYPQGVAVDLAGNIFVTDTSNCTIRKIAPSGAVTTLAGSPGSFATSDGLGSGASFTLPFGLAIDGSGNLYVTESANVRQVTPGGVVMTLAGSLTGEVGAINGAGNAARFNTPLGIAVATDGTIYLADTFNQEIRRIGSGALVTTYAGEHGFGAADGTPGKFLRPKGIAADAAGNLYVADNGNLTIRKITSSGTVSTLAGSAGQSGTVNAAGAAARFTAPSHLAVDAAGNVYVAEGELIRKISAAGAVSTLAGSPGQFGTVNGTGSAARFNSIAGITVDGSGTVYVTQGNGVVRKVTAAGAVTNLAGTTGVYGSTDGTGAAARFNSPGDITCDGAGNLFVCDLGNCTIRKVDASGVVTTVAGTAGVPGSVDGVGGTALFRFPNAIASDSGGTLYVASGGSIRKVTPAGVVTTLAGTEFGAGLRDGIGSEVLFHSVAGITVDGSGRLFVTEGESNVIRRGTASPPVISSPGSATATKGQAFSFAIVCAGSPSTYFASGLPTGLQLDTTTGIISGVPLTGGTFSVTLGATNGNGSTTVSLNLNVLVLTAPSIDRSPASLRIVAGDSAQFTVEASGTSPLDFQWYKDGIPIQDATGSSLNVPHAQASDAGTYTVVVRNAYGSSSSAAAQLTVDAAIQLANLSVRTTTGQGDQTLLVGFVVDGTDPAGTRPLLARAVGPTLSSYGVDGVLADPRLDIVRQGEGAPLVSNDDWAGNAEIQSASARVGAFPLPNPASRDSAAALSVSRGVYSLRVAGPTSGVVLAEIYDAGTGPGALRLVNLSARAKVGTGSSVLIAGFVVTGSGTKRLLIRAVGPGLTKYGVADVLADPSLEVNRLNDGNATLVASNDDWGSDSQIASAAVAVGAFPLDHGSKDSAVLVTLPAGVYSAKVFGTANGTGIALVEIYDVP